MGYPTVRNITSGTTGNATSFSVPLPTSSSGDLLLMILSIDGGNTFSAVSGWTQLAQSNAGGANCLGVWYKTATGSDTSPTVSWSAKEQGTYAVIAYTTGTYTGTPEVSTVASGTSANPTSASITPSWGTTYDTRFISLIGTDATTVVTVNPTNYTVQIDVEGSGQAASISSSSRNLNASSEYPGAYTMNISEQWIAYTIALAGTAGATAPTLKVNIAGVWKNAEMFVNVGGVWKSVTNIETNIGGTWKPWTQ